MAQYGADIAEVYRQVWPELADPVAGTAWPEFDTRLRATGAVALPPLPTVVDTAVARAANY